MNLDSPPNNLDEVLDLFNAVAGDRLKAAQLWKAEGGKVAAYIGNTIPLELLHAAGFLPLHLAGLAKTATPLADRYMEPAFDSLTRSVFDRLLQGHYNFVDLIVLPRSNDAYQRLYYYLCEIERKHGDFKLTPAYLVNLLHVPRATSTRYNHSRLAEFQDLVSKVGSLVDEANLRYSIDLYNDIRRQLAIFNRMRAQNGYNISSALAHAVYAAAQSLPPTLFLPALKCLCDSLPTAEPSKNKRIVLAGNGLDHPGLHNLADQKGFTIVGDYHSLGNHFLVDEVAREGDLLLNLAQHYQSAQCCRSFSSKAGNLVEFAQQQNADAILFHYLTKEEALSWQYPQQRKAAQAAGIPSALSIDQSYDVDESAICEGFAALDKGMAA